MYRSVLTIGLIILIIEGVIAETIKVPVDYPTIQAGINASINGDTVLVADSTYYENINFRGKSITVASYYIMDGDTNHINSTVINGSQPSNADSGSVVSFVSSEDTTSVLCGFTITGGTGTLTDGTSRVGGGIFCYLSGARIKHNKIINNTVTHTGEARGGGIGTFPFGNNNYTIIEKNLIELNSCNSDFIAQGGGVYMPRGRIDRNLIRGNSCQGGDHALGGGIHAASDILISRQLYITNNMIENNHVLDSVAAGYGGGIDIYGGIVVYIIGDTIQNNYASDPVAPYGGGIRLRYSKAPSIIQGNTFSNNRVDHPEGGAGGIGLIQTEGVQIIENRLESNGSAYGGGINLQESSGTIIRGNEILHNNAILTGGGLYIFFSNNVQIDKNIIRQNSAIYGGGMFKVNGNFSITNNFLVENQAQIGGGICGIDYPPQSGLTEIINNTLTANQADTAGGMYLWDQKNILLNTICWDNNAPFAKEILLRGGVMDVAYSDIRFGADSIQIGSSATLNWLDGNIKDDPLLIADSLSNTSPCISAGTQSYNFVDIICYCPLEDINGRARPYPAGSNPDMGAWESLVGFPVGIEQSPEIEIPESFALIHNYPNPFNPSTTIEYYVPRSENIRLTIYDLQGRHVKTLVNKKHPVGYFQTSWDGKNEYNLPVAGGVYFCRLEATEFKKVIKLLFIK